jgi:hypothetical protein
MSNYISAQCQTNQILSQIMSITTCTSDPNLNVVIPIWTAVAMTSEVTLELLRDDPNRYEDPLKCILHPNYSCELVTHHVARISDLEIAYLLMRGTWVGKRERG